jgi:Helicase associated domain
MKEGKSSAMTKERIAKLEMIGFQWRIGTGTGTWDDNFGRLKERIREFGQCDDLVKAYYHQCTPLGKWISGQRFRYKIVSKGYGGSGTELLTAEQIGKLTAIGFPFDGPVARHRKRATLGRRAADS